MALLLRAASLAIGLGVATLACTSSTGSSDAAPASSAPPADTTPPPADTTPPADKPPAPDACGAVAKSKCKPANPGSVVRGIVKFDPARFKGKNKPSLRIFMHHQYVLKDTEATQGGHPHAYDKFDTVDLDKGEARFSLDLCEFGTAMWSEENCGFNIVAIFDEDDSHDPDKVGLPALIPRKGELVAMVPLDVSCHKPSPCLEIKAECTDGEACTTYQALKKCACAAAKCPSDDAICKL